MSAVLQPPPRPVWLLAVVATILSIVIRLVPFTVRPPNFTSFGALSLYAGARLPIWAAFGLPIGGMLIADYLMGFDPSPSTYICYLISIVMGLLLRRTNSVWKIGLTALTLNLLFFLVTNLTVWANSRGKAFEDSFAGALAELIAGIPFYPGTFFGDALFVPLFFLCHAFAERHVTAPEEVKT